MARIKDELQALREDLDSMRNLLELAGILEPVDDAPATTDPDAGAGAADTAGEPETGTGDADSTPADPAPDSKETAVSVTAEDRETRETE